MWALRLVLSLFLIVFISVLCSQSRSLNLLPVTPVQVSFWPVSVCVTVASYITQLVRHLPPTGHFCVPPWQLHMRPPSVWFSSCRSFLLCPDTAWAILGIHLQDNLTVWRLKSLCRGLLGGKEESSKVRNSLPTLLFTFMEQGGLNQVTGFFLFSFLLNLLAQAQIAGYACIHFCPRLLGRVFLPFQISLWMKKFYSTSC